MSTEINITSLLAERMFKFSHSDAEGGENAGPRSWRAAKRDSLKRKPPLLMTFPQRQAFRDFVKSSGGWSEKEVKFMKVVDLNALLLQWIAGDVREIPATLPGVTFYERSEAVKGEKFEDNWYFSIEGVPHIELGPFKSRSEAYAQAAQDQTGCHTGYPGAASLDAIDWPEYATRVKAGSLTGRIFKADDGKIYFSTAV